MNATEMASLISGVSLLLSLGGSASIAGYRLGVIKARLDQLEATTRRAATTEQLAGVKEDVAEIKGMFRMTLRDGNGGS